MPAFSFCYGASSRLNTWHQEGLSVNFFKDVVTPTPTNLPPLPPCFMPQYSVKPVFTSALCAIFFCATASGQLLIDFNSNAASNEDGYQAYNASHENIASFVAASYNTSFASTGAATVTVLPEWTNSTDNRVQQMIQRNDDQTATWTGDNQSLLRDWIGIDTRNGNGGNGSWDGNAGTPTYMTLTLGGLSGATYDMTTFHHDVENMNSFFTIEVSTDGGVNFATPINGQITNSLNGGSPSENEVLPGIAPNIAGGNPVDLDSTQNFSFTANGTNDVVVRFAALDNAGQGVHRQFFALNGFQITSTAPTTGPSGLTLSSLTVARSAPIGTTVGNLATIDPTPGDNFTYTLASGNGDSDNAQFTINGETLETDRDLSGFPGESILSVRIRTTDAGGEWLEEVFQVELVNDTDNDGLDDTWELGYFHNLTAATGSGDNDSDGLNNLEEQAAGTNPVDTDTDGDNLGDAEEINVHGSDPTITDSDADGLSDGEEVSAANGHVTDPTKADSDDDGFNDALEIAEGSDPNNQADFPNTLLPLRLNEFLARNDTDIEDGFGDNQDWIEIFNPNSQTVNLDGYHLTDNATKPAKWDFPPITIPAQGYLLIFASGKDLIDPAGNPHTNFQLSADGEYLAIVRPDGVTIDHAFSPAFPGQFTDISCGGAGDIAIFYQVSTPGSANSSTAYPGVVRDTSFSVDRGFYDAPFQVSISSATAGATIRYTLDGSEPSPSSGTIYNSPVDITTTTNLRAIAYMANWLPTNADSHTYIFVDDVAQQPANPPGWPTTWGSHDNFRNIPADYQMDPRVVNNTNGLGVHTIRQALLDIPTVSVAMDIDDFMSDSTGIYANSQNRTEKICSVEYILPDGAAGFQENCKIEVHGNASRRPARMHKHSLRLTFSSAVGRPKLRYPLFPDSTVEEFNKLVLRACFTDSWALVSWSSGRYRPNDSQYLRDVWMKDSLRDMGQPSSHGNFVHLYVNGLYFGLHNLTERLEDDFFADHLGGDRDDWLINKDLSSAPSRWNTMMGILNGNIANNSVYNSARAYIDVENYADYMLLHYYADSEDWPHHNGYAAANSNSGDGKFRFFVWDQEIALDKFSWNRYNSGSGGGAPFQRLRQNGEFRMLFADRVHKHMFNGGAISEQGSSGRYMELAARIDKAIVAESARWGDVQETVSYANTPGSSTNIDADYYPPLLNNPIYFTREQHWAVERDNVVNHYIPVLHDPSDSRSIIRELRANNLYPSIDPPSFSQHGGNVASGYNLGMGAPTGTIHYTLDGSDPRLTGGAINPAAGMLSSDTSVTTLVDLEETGWRYLDTGIARSDSEITAGHPGWGAADWKHPGFDERSWASGQALLGYGTINGREMNRIVGPSGNPRHPTTYFRKQFQVTGATLFTRLTVRIIRDDGAILYLNGHEIKRSNINPGNQQYGDFAQGSANPEGELIDLGDYTLNNGELVEGANILAVEVHQQSSNSSDLGIDVEIKGTRPNGDGSGVTLTQSGTVNARTFSNGEWSALTTAEFIVGVRGNSTNLVVSELMYNPPGTSEDTEFVELMNIDPDKSIDLTDVSLTGITYTFPVGYVLDPLDRVVIVKDRDAFATTHDTAGINIAPGDFSSTSLSNSGEEIALLGASGTDIRRFSYDDNAPWPVAPDGNGYSLVLIAPESSPDHALASNWRSSTEPGGNPGSSDAWEPFTGEPGIDNDNDGLSGFLEHALGSSDTQASPESYPVVGSSLFDDDTGTLREYLTITYRRNLAADDVIYEIELSTDATNWSPDGIIFVASIPNADGTESVTCRSSVPVSDMTRQLIHLKVTSR